jgi:hypothetical protein
VNHQKVPRTKCAEGWLHEDAVQADRGGSRQAPLPHRALARLEVARAAKRGHARSGPGARPSAPSLRAFSDGLEQSLTEQSEGLDEGQGWPATR